MTEQLKVVQVNEETTETFHVYRGEKLIAYVIAMDGNGQLIKELLEPAPERRARASGISGVKSVERLDQLLADDDDGPPTKELPASAVRAARKAP